MARVCELCGKGVLSTRRIKHKVRQSNWRFRATAKPRKLAPNLRNVKLQFDDRTGSAKICMKCYKRLRKED